MSQDLGLRIHRVLSFVCEVWFRGFGIHGFGMRVRSERPTRTAKNTNDNIWLSDTLESQTTGHDSGSPGAGSLACLCVDRSRDFADGFTLGTIVEGRPMPSKLTA